MVLGILGPLGLTQIGRVYLCFVLWAAFVAALACAEVLPLSPTVQQGYLTYLGIVCAAPACIALGAGVLNAFPHRHQWPINLLLLGTLVLPVVVGVGGFLHDRAMGMLALLYAVLVCGAVLGAGLHLWPG